MKKRWLSVAAIAALCIAVAVLAPMAAYWGADSATLNKSFPIEAAPGGIEVSSSEIPLVANARKILSGTNEGEASYRPSSFDSMYTAMHDLLESDVVPQDVATLLSETYDGLAPEDAECYLGDSGSSYSIACFSPSGDGLFDECRCTLEAETGRVIFFQLYSSQIGFSNTTTPPPDREQTLASYLEYLGLDILGDWVYNGNRYHSEEAGLYVNMEYDAGGYFYIGLELQ